MTIEKLQEALADFPPNMELRVEFDIDHHVPIERINEYHPDGVIGSDENYLLLILE